jgi:hypothetical protein
MEDVLIRFRLMNDEAQALYKLSSNELRQPRDQVRYILRRELKRLGLLSLTPIVKQESINYDRTNRKAN